MPNIQHRALLCFESLPRLCGCAKEDEVTVVKPRAPSIDPALGSVPSFSGKGDFGPNVKGGSGDEWWRATVTNSTLEACYKLGRVIGRGATSVVKEGTAKKSGEKFALKIISLKAIPHEKRSAKREDYLREVHIWSQLKHPGIVNLIEFFVEPDTVTLVMEMCKGASLLDEVLDRGGYSGDDARRIITQILDTLRYLHGMGVVHRDVKLENVLLRHRNDLNSLKLADMGFAIKVDTSTGTYKNMAGTPAYLAPEVVAVLLQQPHAVRSFTVNTDIWSAGISLFILLGGYPPFDAESTAQVFQRIQNEEVSFDARVWDSVPSAAKAMIRRLLERNPRKRITANQALRDPYLEGGRTSARNSLDGPRRSLEMKSSSFLNLKNYLEHNLTVPSEQHEQMEDDNEMEKSQSVKKGKFIELQEKHDKSRGKHLNESLRKIFNRNANQCREQPEQDEEDDLEASRSWTPMAMPKGRSSKLMTQRFDQRTSLENSPRSGTPADDLQSTYIKLSDLRVSPEPPSHPSPPAPSDGKKRPNRTRNDRKSEGNALARIS